MISRRNFLLGALAICALERQPAHADTIVLGRSTLRARDLSRARDVVIDVWYPPAAGANATVPGGVWITPPEAIDAVIEERRHSVVMLSHGFHGTPSTMTWLVAALVTRGFIVAGPTHDDPHMGYLHMNHWNRALDVSFALTTLLKSRFAPHIDAGRVAMTGFSLGGGTGIWLAGGIASDYRRTLNPGPAYAPQEEFFPVGSPQYLALEKSTDFKTAARSYRDARLKAFYLFAPSLGWAFDAAHLRLIDVPMQIELGSADQMLVPATNGEYFARTIPGCRLTVVPRAGHYVFLNEVRPASLRADPALAEIAVDPAGIDRAAVHAVAGRQAAEFLLSRLSA